jgi:ribosome maturation factor RimP
MNDIENRIHELLSEVLADIDGYLVELRVRPGKVEVFADRDPHITIEDCTRISRKLQKELEEEFAFSDQYELEVSSPGMDQPFKVLRQYKKSVGRNVEVLLFSGVKKTGMLMYADDDKIILEEKIVKSKKEIESVQTEIPFVQIKSTNLVFNFKMQEL